MDNKLKGLYFLFVIICLVDYSLNNFVKPNNLFNPFSRVSVLFWISFLGMNLIILKLLVNKKFTATSYQIFLIICTYGLIVLLPVLIHKNPYYWDTMYHLSHSKIIGELGFIPSLHSLEGLIYHTRYFYWPLFFLIPVVLNKLLVISYLDFVNLFPLIIYPITLIALLILLKYFLEDNRLILLAGVIVLIMDTVIQFHFSPMVLAFPFILMIILFLTRHNNWKEKILMVLFSSIIIMGHPTTNVFLVLFVLTGYFYNQRYSPKRSNLSKNILLIILIITFGWLLFVSYSYVDIFSQTHIFLKETKSLLEGNILNETLEPNQPIALPLNSTDSTNTEYFSMEIVDNNFMKVFKPKELTSFSLNLRRVIQLSFFIICLWGLVIMPKALRTKESSFLRIILLSLLPIWFFSNWIFPSLNARVLYFMMPLLSIPFVIFINRLQFKLKVMILVIFLLIVSPFMVYTNYWNFDISILHDSEIASFNYLQKKIDSQNGLVGLRIDPRSAIIFNYWTYKTIYNPKNPSLAYFSRFNFERKWQMREIIEWEILTNDKLYNNENSLIFSSNEK